MAREQYPDLIGLSPKKQLSGLSSMSKSKCGKRNKSCSVHGGGCGYRFKKGDKHWICPECGADRRCWGNHVKGGSACRMHGAKGGRKPSKEKAILANIKGFNDILNSPNLLDNVTEIAAVKAISLQLIEEMTEHDQGALLDDANRAAAMIAGGLHKGYQPRIQAGVDMLLEALAPLSNARDLRHEYYETTKIHNLLVNNQLKWMMENRQMVPWVQVIEFMSIFQRFMFRYLPSSTDRANFLKDMRPYFTPSEDKKALNA